LELLQGLNPPQQEAVKWGDGPLLVLAGAGSGKTRVLTRRVAYLMQTGVSPEQILAITFTNKAAAEMKERLVALVGPAAQRLWVSTFHSACVRILRGEIDVLGYNKNFVIYDDADQQTLLKACLRESNLDEKKYPPRAVAARIGQAKNDLKTPEGYAAAADNPLEYKIADLYRLYQRKLKENNALDFDDLIMQTVLLFSRHPDVLHRYQDRWHYLMVDEYQDTNHAQYLLVKLLAAARRNLAVVGDPDQSIYGWRGADIQNILDFEKDYPDARIIKLEQNYRSTVNILNAANGVIAHNANRQEKKLWSELGEGERVQIFEGEDERAEAAFLAREIERLRREEKYRLQDFAVLYRTHALSRVLEEALMELNLPYTIYGGTRFYDRREIKDLVAYLRVLANPRDDLSLKRIVNVPRRGVGETSLARLEAFSQEKGISLRQAIARAREIEALGTRFVKPLLELSALLDLLQEEKDKLTVTELVGKILQDSGYLADLEAQKTTEAETRIENLKEFLSAASAYDREAAEPSLEDFLAQISLVSDQDRTNEGEDQVTLMTLHSAKGLEFPVVFILGMEEGVFPHGRALLDETQLEEERRLCYVGMTRARERLYLGRAWSRTLYGNTLNNPKSRFLAEIPPAARAEGAGKQKRALLKGQAFGLGDKVHHTSFGDGVVVAVRGEGLNVLLEVAFPDLGIKQLSPEYAPLKKIN